MMQLYERTTLTFGLHCTFVEIYFLGFRFQAMYSIGNIYIYVYTLYTFVESKARVDRMCLWFVAGGSKEHSGPGSGHGTRHPRPPGGYGLDKIQPGLLPRDA